jgi:hypothetical protein
MGCFKYPGKRYIGNSEMRGSGQPRSRMRQESWIAPALQPKLCQEEETCTPLPKTRSRRDNICLIGTYLVPLESRTLLTNS